MTAATLPALIVVTLAVARVTRLTTTDEITEPLRMALARRFPPADDPRQNYRWQTGRPIPNTGTVWPHWSVRLVWCDWCVSVWWSFVACLVMYLVGFLSLGWAAACWWGVAGAAGMLLAAVSG